MALRPGAESQVDRAERFLGFKSAQGDGKCWDLLEGEAREQLEARIEAEAKAEGRTSLMVTERYLEANSFD